MTDRTTPAPAVSAHGLILPLALAQFIASYAATNMNVAISAIAEDLDTTVIGIQTTITLFTLVMASLMIPGSKLTDIWGRKQCLRMGLLIYGTGALLAALAPGLAAMMVGYSLLEGVGSALMIPPIYILITVVFTDLESRAKNFGIVSGAGGLGAAAGPLIGGMVTTAFSWRASFGLQVLVVVWILFLSRRIVDPPLRGVRPTFDLMGAILSGLGLFFLVFGILQSGTYGWITAREPFEVAGVVLIPEGGISPVWVFVAVGAAFLAWFFAHIRARERAGRDPLLSLRLFHNRASNLGLATQTLQWLILQGAFFIISVYLQQVRGYNAIQNGLVLLPATIGILAASAAAERMASRHPQRRLVRAGFNSTALGMILLLLLVRDTSSTLTFVPGLLLMGIGIGTMLTASVNLVQSSFPDSDQGDISGLSRSVSNLGSSLGTALVGSVLVAATSPAGSPFLLAMGVLTLLAFVGAIVALLLPKPRAVRS